MPYAGPGPSLSEEGRRQAEEAAQHVAEIRPSLSPLVALYTSPLVRTRETAGILGKVLGLEAVERPALADCDMGEWAGVPLRELARKPEWPTVQHYPSGFRFPGGETIAGMQFRLVEAVRELVERHPGQSIVVVSHADPIKALLAEALGVHLDLFQRIHIAPASVSAVTYGPTGPSVLFVNWARSWPAGNVAPSGRGRGARDRR
jgi:probable phosphomutase (TIGR03848 family)